MAERDPMDGLFESRDARFGPLMTFAVGLVMLIAVAALVASWIVAGLSASHEAEADPHPLRELREPPPRPLLQALPRQELEEQRRTEAALLSSYGWIDETNEVVRMPIEHAMQLTVERGLPVREEGR